MTAHRTRLAAALVVSMAALAACGGGDDDPPPADPLAQAPAEAGQSSGGLIAYLKQLVGLMPEDREPVAIDAIDPQKTDNAEPEPLT